MEGHTTWVEIATVDGNCTTYTDLATVSPMISGGTAYYYTVRAIRGRDVSTITTGRRMVYLKPPTLTGISLAVNGVKLSWESSKAATRYRVLRRTENSSVWVSVKEVSGTVYTDTTARSGVTYHYTIRALNEQGNISTILSGRKMEYLQAPVVTEAAKQSSGIWIKWDKVGGAASFWILRKQSGSSTWVKVGEVSGDETTFTDQSAREGVKYTYTVRAFDAKGNMSTITSGRTVQN